MEIEKVNELLNSVALHHIGHGEFNQEDALKSIALALSHIAGAVHKLEHETMWLKLNVTTEKHPS